MVYWTINGAEREKQHEDLPSVLHWSQFSRETFCFPPLSVSHPEPFLQDRERDYAYCKSGCTIVADMFSHNMWKHISYMFSHIFISWNKSSFRFWMLFIWAQGIFKNSPIQVFTLFQVHRCKFISDQAQSDFQSD